MYLFAFQSTAPFLLDLFFFIYVDYPEYKWSIKDNTTYRFGGKKRTHFYPLVDSSKTNKQGSQIEIKKERERERNEIRKLRIFSCVVRSHFSKRIFLYDFSLDENI